MYYIYEGDKKLIEIQDYKHLINYISQYNSFFGTVFRNRIIDMTGINTSDKVLVATIDRDIVNPRFKVSAHPTFYVPRSYRIYDDNYNRISASSLVTDVMNWKYDKNLYLETVRFNNRDKKSHKSKKDSASFRSGSVPYTGKRSRIYSSSYRVPRVMREKRHLNDPEEYPLVRKSRKNNLPDSYWNDWNLMRDWRNNGWKSQGKRSRQWENKVVCKQKSKSKGIYVCQRDLSKILSSDRKEKVA